MLRFRLRLAIFLASVRPTSGMAGGGGGGGGFGARNPIRAYYAFCVNMSTIFKYQHITQFRRK